MAYKVSLSEMFATFVVTYEQNTESVSLFSLSESGKFIEERVSGHLLASYLYGLWRGAVAYFIFRVFQNPLN